MTYLVVQGASVTVVRDGKQQTIKPGTGCDFTEDEIETIRTAVPGALRAPVVEASSEEAPSKPAKATKAAKAAKPGKAAKTDDDEDEDI